VPNESSRRLSTDPRLAPNAAGLLIRLIVLFAPAAVIALGGLVTDNPVKWTYWVGAGLVGFLGLVLIPQTSLGHSSTAIAVIAEYILAQVWLWFSQTPGQRHWFQHFSQGVLLVVPALLIGAAALVRTGVQDLRRARLIIRQLQRRRNWPADRMLIQAMPEVFALRDAVQTDASPALALLNGSRPEVQVAALSALAYRRHWGPNQEELVLQAARDASDPAVRVAAINALVHSSDHFLLEAVAGFLADPAPEVRRAAGEAAIAAAGRHWATLRYAVHEEMADAQFAADGPLPLGTGELPPQVVSDLHEWAGEGGVLARRATATLIAYYGQLLDAHSSAEALAEDLRYMVRVKSTPSILRVELAQLLFEQNLLDAAAMEPLLGSDQPTALRLLAADAILSVGRNEKAEETLRSIAKLPNREITLAVAQMLQKRLGVDVGLNLQKPPAVQSRQAAEIARRVMQWAAEEPAPRTEDRAAAAEAAPRSKPMASGYDWDFGPPPERPKTSSGGAGSELGKW
jgi:hypothetical protein